MRNVKSKLDDLITEEDSKCLENLSDENEELAHTQVILPHSIVAGASFDSLPERSSRGEYYSFQPPKTSI